MVFVCDPLLTLALPLLVVAGSVTIIIVTASNMLLQSLVSDHLRGRVKAFCTVGTDKRKQRPLMYALRKRSRPISRKVWSSSDCYLPSYSPELNPEEQLSVGLKQAIGSKVPTRTKAKLREMPSTNTVMLENNPERVVSYFQNTRIKYAV